jgi:hypothetical protein
MLNAVSTLPPPCRSVRRPLSILALSYASAMYMARRLGDQLRRPSWRWNIHALASAMVCTLSISRHFGAAPTSLHARKRW